MPNNKYFRQQRKIELIFGPICARLPNIGTDFMLMPRYKCMLWHGSRQIFSCAAARSAAASSSRG